MPEVVSPSANNPAPKPNGTAPVAAAPAPQPGDEMTKLRAELAATQAKAERLEKKQRVDNIEMMKFRDEKKGLGAKLTEHGAYEKAFKVAGLTPADLSNFKVNPTAVFKKTFGDGWRDALAEAMVSGGAPTAEAVAAEIARAKNEAIEEVRRERDEADANVRKQAQERETQAREQLVSEADGFLEKSGAEYPIFDGLPRAQVARALAHWQEQHFHRTGKVATAKEACDALEANEISRAERLASIEKYRGKLTEKLKPANTSPVVGARIAGSTQSEQRRMQPNDPNSQKRHSRTDEERRAAIMALKLPGE